ncbi:hypothetical protein HTZ84_04055 [Haloterrigena sp. SYSU A558-1]|uniref:ATP-binding protein n=1 Tax=Haloterrigena gelatinilytica TaxID=2741724 RepID=A0ABX2LD65_9EURY|nr:hypothetical protein [Haloterrigena gelatinilytica]NUC71492.1 hypothetical protein [Haloterrigena gelatinilytica]
MFSDNLKAHEVFGTQRSVPVNYVEREDVDEELLHNLERDRFVVIHGGSKQGKTCLRNHCIEEKEHAVISCQYNRGFEELQKSILKGIGFETEVLREQTTSEHTKIRAKATAKIPGFGEAGGSGEAKAGTTDKQVYETLEIDPTDVNDIIRALEDIRLDGYITIEDFHYLPIEVQRKFASTLKALYDRTEVTFVIVGVWLEENRLIVHSGDLAGRVVSVDADDWSPDELREVIRKGENRLNINLDHKFKNYLINNCYDSVFIVQEACLKACQRSGVEEKQASKTTIAEDINAEEVIDEVVAEQGAKYRAFLRKFADGFRKTDYELYKWILYSVVTTDTNILETGLGIHQIMSDIEEKHPKTDDLNQGNLTQSLERVVDLQIEGNIEPIILDYNSNDRRLDVVDNRFLIWLENTPEDTLLNLIDVE